MYKLFIFDFDGTIGDSSACIVASYKAVFDKHELLLPDEEAIIASMGLPLAKVLQQLTGSFDQILIEEMANEYRQFYEEFLADHTNIFPGMPKLLRTLKEKGIRCTVATSKRTYLAELSCQHLGIADYFKLIVGEDKVAKHKPDPATVLYTLQKLSISATEALVIGDSTFDMEMARNARVDYVGVSWGAHSRETLLATQPLAVVDSPDDLLRFID